MPDQVWPWLLSIVGVVGFELAGRKIWWAWYVNIACQGLWFAYAIVTQQYGFLVGAFFYLYVFVKNAYKWTKEHRNPPKTTADMMKLGEITGISIGSDGGVTAIGRLNEDVKWEAKHPDKAQSDHRGW